MSARNIRTKLGDFIIRPLNGTDLDNIKYLVDEMIQEGDYVFGPNAKD